MTRHSSLSRILTHIAIFAAMLTSVWLAPGCSQSKVSDSNITLISENEMIAAVGDPKNVVVDVRKPDQYAAGHIPGAVNIYLPELRASDPRLTGAKRIIVYGNGWTDPLSVAGTKRLMGLGYNDVAEFKGGMELWLDAGQRAVTATPSGEIRPDTGG